MRRFFAPLLGLLAVVLLLAVSFALFTGYVSYADPAGGFARVPFRPPAPRRMPRVKEEGPVSPSRQARHPPAQHRPRRQVCAPRLSL
jgi:hypothetical protein